MTQLTGPQLGSNRELFNKSKLNNIGIAGVDAAWKTLLKIIDTPESSDGSPVSMRSREAERSKALSNASRDLIAQMHMGSSALKSRNGSTPKEAKEEFVDSTAQALHTLLTEYGDNDELQRILRSSVSGILNFSISPSDKLETIKDKMATLCGHKTDEDSSALNTINEAAAVLNRELKGTSGLPQLAPPTERPAKPPVDKKSDETTNAGVGDVLKIDAEGNLRRYRTDKKGNYILLEEDTKKAEVAPPQDSAQIGTTHRPAIAPTAPKIGDAEVEVSQTHFTPADFDAIADDLSLAAKFQEAITPEPAPAPDETTTTTSKIADPTEISEAPTARFEAITAPEPTPDRVSPTPTGTTAPKGIAEAPLPKVNDTPESTRTSSRGRLAAWAAAATLAIAGVAGIYGVTHKTTKSIDPASTASASAAGTVEAPKQEAAKPAPEKAAENAPKKFALKLTNSGLEKLIEGDLSAATGIVKAIKLAAIEMTDIELTAPVTDKDGKVIITDYTINEKDGETKVVLTAEGKEKVLRQLVTAANKHTGSSYFNDLIKHLDDSKDRVGKGQIKEVLSSSHHQGTKKFMNGLEVAEQVVSTAEIEGIAISTETASTSPNYNPNLGIIGQMPEPTKTVLNEAFQDLKKEPYNKARQDAINKILADQAKAKGLKAEDAPKIGSVQDLFFYDAEKRAAEYEAKYHVSGPVKTVRAIKYDPRVKDALKKEIKVEKVKETPPGEGGDKKGETGSIDTLKNQGFSPEEEKFFAEGREMTAQNEAAAVEAAKFQAENPEYFPAAKPSRLEQVKSFAKGFLGIKEKSTEEKEREELAKSIPKKSLWKTLVG